MRCKGIITTEAMIAVLVFLGILSMMLSLQVQNIEGIRNKEFDKTIERLETEDTSDVLESFGYGRETSRECDSCMPHRRWYAYE